MRRTVGQLSLTRSLSASVSLVDRDSRQSRLSTLVTPMAYREDMREAHVMRPWDTV